MPLLVTGSAPCVVGGHNPQKNASLGGATPIYKQSGWGKTPFSPSTFSRHLVPRCS